MPNNMPSSTKRRRILSNSLSAVALGSLGVAGNTQAANKHIMALKNKLRLSLKCLIGLMQKAMKLSLIC
ncbi:MAG: hypothetical protein ACI9J2_002679 [Saprospiraceae bacterium]|jgi:hypothetical protein